MSRSVEGEDLEDEVFYSPKKGKPSKGKRASKLLFIFLLGFGETLGSELAEFLIHLIRG